jgi:ATP-dependent DNA ligase
MLALSVPQIPEGDFFYEPKWDGFRALVFRDGDQITIQSRNGKPLNRYFPELVSGLPAVLPPRIVLDGEIVIAGARGLDFEALLQRIHPATSRVQKLAALTPAVLVAFDLLALGDEDLRDRPFAVRRAALVEALTDARAPLMLTPATRDHEAALRWFSQFEGAGLDGVVAKGLELPYLPGQRVMFKIKHARTADCVVAGYRPGRDGRGLASLLLGLYADDVLSYVGVATGLDKHARAELAAALEPLALPADAPHPWRDEANPRVPDAPSRWSKNDKLDWIAVRPELVVEVAYDHLQGARFRHATHYKRLRPDRQARSCTYDQLEAAQPFDLAGVLAPT